MMNLLFPSVPASLHTCPKERKRSTEHITGLHEVINESKTLFWFGKALTSHPLTAVCKQYPILSLFSEELPLSLPGHQDTSVQSVWLGEEKEIMNEYVLLQTD